VSVAHVNKQVHRRIVFPLHNLHPLHPPRLQLHRQLHFVNSVTCHPIPVCILFTLIIFDAATYPLHFLHLRALAVIVTMPVCACICSLHDPSQASDPPFRHPSSPDVTCTILPVHMRHPLMSQRVPAVCGWPWTYA
jgi:hypothetical protein